MPDIEEKASRRKKREKIIILITAFAVVGLALLETRVLNVPLGGVFSRNILLFIFINLNLILLLLLIFLVLRNIAKLVFERRRNILGSRLKTKLTLAFILFALVPTTFLFFVALQFINKSIDYWFNVRVERSLQNSLEVGRTYYKQIEGTVLACAEMISSDIGRSGCVNGSVSGLDGILKKRGAENRLDTVQVVLPTYEQAGEFRSPKVVEDVPVPSKIIRRCLSGEKGLVDTHLLSNGDLVRAFVPVYDSSQKEIMGVVGAGSFIPTSLARKMDDITKGIEDYKQLKLLKQPIKMSLILVLVVVALVIIFSATWFGFYLASGVTIPIQYLAEGTRRIAGGDLDFTIDVKSEDEIGTLVNSFNKMTKDLKTSHSELEKATSELQRSSFEQEQRRRYMEIILENVAAGVISLDNDGRIGTMNKFAEELFGIKPEGILGKTYQELSSPEQLEILNSLLGEAHRNKKGLAQRTVRITARGKSLALLINVALLKDDAGNDIGTVIVFDDLTQLEKAQRMAAWREVARRIAHEVKNPLTPIQLSAQRLRKRYIEKLADDSKVLDDCTRTIINQVEELKNLVNEFSSFARLPATNPTLNGLEEVIEEVVTLYRDSRKNVQFVTRAHQSVPKFYFDREQIKRVMINLLDNAIAAMNGTGEIDIDIYNETVNPSIVRVEVSDTGKGIASEDKSRVFEPYFSTKKGGTGLGLAITSTIISDHNGYIRIQDNEPKGARFVFELPLWT